MILRRNFVKPVHYANADTGEIIETVQMRVFQIREYGNWELARHYVLSDEMKLNPGFGKSPQNDRAFPVGRERY